MIDLGISKLALIGAVALIVIGPERLPKVARTVGALVGRAQRYINDVKAEVSREVELEVLEPAAGGVVVPGQAVRADVLHATVAPLVRVGGVERLPAAPAAVGRVLVVAQAVVEVASGPPWGPP